MAAPALFLVVEVGPDTAAGLKAALKASPVASVLLRPSAGGTLDAASVKPIVELLQRESVAALIADDADLARIVRADGVHLSWSKDQTSRYADAREVLGQRFIVGADAGRSRDDAMTLGEDGADYVAFGIPPHVEDRDTAFERQCELIGWWSEIFEPPCIAFDADTEAAAAALAAVNADFIAVTLAAALTPQECSTRVAAFAAAINSAAVPA